MPLPVKPSCSSPKHWSCSQFLLCMHPLHLIKTFGRLHLQSNPNPDASPQHYSGADCYHLASGLFQYSPKSVSASSVSLIIHSVHHRIKMARSWALPLLAYSHYAFPRMPLPHPPWRCSLCKDIIIPTTSFWWRLTLGCRVNLQAF